MAGGVAKMRPVQGGLEIKPGETVELKPGSHHVMFTDLKKPLKAGEHFKATLTFEKAGKVDVDCDVRAVGATAGKGMPGMKMPASQ
jgi:copper(I)-binding protein